MPEMIIKVEDSTQEEDSSSEEHMAINPDMDEFISSVMPVEMEKVRMQRKIDDKRYYLDYITHPCREKDLY